MDPRLINCAGGFCCDNPKEMRASLEEILDILGVANSAEVADNMAHYGVGITTQRLLDSVVAIIRNYPIGSPGPTG